MKSWALFCAIFRLEEKPLRGSASLEYASNQKAPEWNTLEPIGFYSNAIISF